PPGSTLAPCRSRSPGSCGRSPAAGRRCSPRPPSSARTPPPRRERSEAVSGPDPNGQLVPRWVRGNTNLFATLVTAVVVGIGLFLVSWLAPVIGPLGLGLFIAPLARPPSPRLR